VADLHAHLLAAEDQRRVAGAQAHGAMGAAHQHAIAGGGLLGPVQAAGPVCPQFRGSGLGAGARQQERAAAQPLGLRAEVRGELALEVVQQHAFGGQGHVEGGLAGGDGTTGQLQAPFLLAAGPHPGPAGRQFRGTGVDLDGAGRVEQQGDAVVQIHGGVVLGPDLAVGQQAEWCDAVGAIGGDRLAHRIDGGHGLLELDRGTGAFLTRRRGRRRRLAAGEGQQGYANESGCPERCLHVCASSFPKPR
jgi:hypothetical protein